MKNKKKYCVYCGTENDAKTNKCKKCGKALNNKPHELIDYFKSKIKDEAEDKFWSILKSYLKSNLYGVVVSVSVIFTATTVVVTNLGDNYIEKVTTAPTISNVAQTPKYTYAGEGLDGTAVCQKYVDAIASEDVETLKSLQLENFYPEIHKEILDTYNDGIKNNIPIYDLPLIHHDLVVNEQIYISHPDPSGFYDKYYIDDSGGNIGIQLDNGIVTKSTGVYEKYNIDSCEFFCTYHYNDNHIEIHDEIEFIEIGGNYYIIGEGPYYFWIVLSTMAQREYIIQNGNGDLSQLEPYVSVFDEYITDEDIENSLDNNYWKNTNRDKSILYTLYGYGV